MKSTVRATDPPRLRGLGPYGLSSKKPGLLSQGLATEVINLAKEGGGFAQSMAYFLTHKGELTSSPTWIVWELTERCLHEPLSEHDLALPAMVGRS